MKIGYARVSSAGQSLELQLEALTAAGCDKTYCEKQSGGSADNRPELAKALDQLRPGDELICTRLDRLARSVPDLYAIMERVDKAGAAFACLHQAIETASATGKLILGVLGAVAQFERDLLRERQAEGIAAAKAKGVYRGRKAEIDPEKVADAYLEHGSYGKAAKALTEQGHPCSKASVGRILAERASAADAAEREASNIGMKRSTSP